VLNVIEHFRRDAHEGRPSALRLTPPYPFPAPPFTIAPSRGTGLVHHTRTLTEATTERYWPAPANSATNASRFLGATTIGTRHHDGSLRVGLRFAERVERNSPKHFLSTLAIFTKRDGEGGIRLFAAQPPMSVATQLKKPCQSAALRQDWRGDLEQSDAKGMGRGRSKAWEGVSGSSEKVTSDSWRLFFHGINNLRAKRHIGGPAFR
jgi:hypothetical protein